MRNLLCLILLCASSIVSAANSSIGDSLILNSIYDEHIGIQDPRIRSIIYVAKHNVDSSVEVCYQNYDGKQIAKNLANIFEKNNLQFSIIESVGQIQNQLTIKIIQESN